MFNVNDRIVVANYEEMPNDGKSRGMGRVCGKHGVVVDRVYSAATKQHHYKVQLDDFQTVSTVKFSDDMLELEKPKEHGVQITIADSVVIARMFSPSGKMISEGHGHVFGGTGSERIAQATAYACRRMWKEMKRTV